jgi:hypothetical protein
MGKHCQGSSAVYEENTRMRFVVSATKEVNSYQATTYQTTICLNPEDSNMEKLYFVERAELAESVLGLGMDWTAKESGIDFRQGQGVLFYFTTSTWTVGFTQPPILGFFIRLRRKTDHSPP